MRQRRRLTATASQKVAVTTAFNTSANSSVHALRIGDVTVGGTNTITIGSAAPVADGAGLILSQATARTHTPKFTFGAAGDREAVIYVTGGANVTLSGAISANGLTKFGANTLILTGTNTGLQGTSRSTRARSMEIQQGSTTDRSSSMPGP